MAMRMRWSNARGISRFSKSKATLDAPGRRHQATTSSISPQRPLGQQKNKHQSTNDSKKVAKLMAMAMRWCFLSFTESTDQTMLILVMMYVLGMGIMWTCRDEMRQWDIPMRWFCSLLEVDVAGDGAISKWQDESSIGVSYIKLTRRTSPMSLNTRRGGIT